MTLKSYDSISAYLSDDKLNDVQFLSKFYKCNIIDLSKRRLIVIEHIIPFNNNSLPLVARIFPELVMNTLLTIKGQWFIFRYRKH